MKAEIALRSKAMVCVMVRMLVTGRLRGVYKRFSDRSERVGRPDFFTYDAFEHPLNAIENPGFTIVKTANVKTMWMVSRRSNKATNTLQIHGLYNCSKVRLSVHLRRWVRAQCWDKDLPTKLIISQEQSQPRQTCMYSNRKSDPKLRPANTSTSAPYYRTRLLRSRS